MPLKSAMTKPDSYAVDETVELALEKGQWKIVGGLFAVSENG